MKILHSDFSQIIRWDINAIECYRYQKEHPKFQPLDECIEEGGPVIRPFDQPAVEWPVYGVDNRNGVSLAYVMPGREFNQPYKHIKHGDFVHNPTRANVGSFGRVSEVEDNALTSPDYQVWRVRSGYLPEFMEVLIKTKKFLSLVDIHRVGAVKRRLFVANLKAMHLPRPFLAQQKKMVGAFHLESAKIKMLEDDENIAQLAFDKFLSKEFDFNPDCFNKKGFSEEVDFSGLDRWDLPFFRTGYVALHEWFDQYPCALTLGEAAIFRFEGWEANDFPDGEFGYLEIGGVHKTDGVVDLTPTSVFDAPSRAQYRCFSGDILISMTRPYLGKIAMIEDMGDGCVCSSGFSVISGTRGDLDKDYLFFILRSVIGMSQFEQRMSGGSYPAISQLQLEKIRIPIPSLESQKKIAEYGWLMLKDARNISRKRLDTAKKAIKPFEALFN